MVAPGTLAVHDSGINDGGMNSEDWRDYATALDDAASGLEAFTGRLASAAGEFDPFAPHGLGTHTPSSLSARHGKLVKALREQARQALVKHETSREP